jgi:endoglucanase
MDGELSGDLSLLTTSGNRIVVAKTGEPILLRGVNRSGMEHCEPDEEGFCSAVGTSRAEIEFIVRTWNCNIIRLPFNQDWALHGRNGCGAEVYLRDLDRIISWAARYGAYTLLDLQWLDADRVFGGSRNLVAPLPNLLSIDLWTLLARRYRSEPAVLYDIFSEPHDRLSDDPYPLGREDGSSYPLSQREVTMTQWKPWAHALINAIRAENPLALVFVSGTDWGYDLRGMPLDAPNLVYSTHVYRNKGSNWPEAFGNLATGCPVFAAEWGGGQQDRAWGRRLVRYFDELQMGWAAWSWSNEPLLVSRYMPTGFGEIVRDTLWSSS